MNVTQTVIVPEDDEVPEEAIQTDLASCLGVSVGCRQKFVIVSQVVSVLLSVLVVETEITFESAIAGSDRELATEKFIGP